MILKCALCYVGYIWTSLELLVIMLPYFMFKCNSLCVVSIKQNTNFNLQPPSTFVFLCFKDLSQHKISLSRLDWCNFCIHLRSLKVHNFGTIEEATESNCGLFGYLQWHGLPTEFRKYVLIGSKVIRGTHRQADRQTGNGDLISLTFPFK
jgi:hypothetical protein